MLVWFSQEHARTSGRRTDEMFVRPVVPQWAASMFPTALLGATSDSVGICCYWTSLATGKDEAASRQAIYVTAVRIAWDNPSMVKTYTLTRTSKWALPPLGYY